MKYYTVFRGYQPGVYDNWDEAKEQTEGYPGALYKSYPTSEEATMAFRSYSGEDDLAELAQILDLQHEAEMRRTGNTGGRRRSQTSPHPIMTFPPSNPEIEADAWAVDAACSGNPGIMEYRCVDLKTGTEVFRMGPYEDATNNTGEYLALVHAMALMGKRGEWHNIYSDSRTAISWWSKKRVNTSLKPTERNAKVFELLARASVWVNTHQFPRHVMKWDTDRWGEIPADFGRK